MRTSLQGRPPAEWLASAISVLVIIFILIVVLS
jgi:hypothetical protein